MGGLFGSKTKVVESTPEPTPVVRMPDTEDPAVKQAERRNALASQIRSGRSSTVLTSRQQRASSGASAGTQAYGNSLLGQAG